MGYLFLNVCIVGTMTKSIVNPLRGRFLEVFSGREGVCICVMCIIVVELLYHVNALPQP